MTEVIILQGFENDLHEGIDYIYYCKQEVVLKAHSHTVPFLENWILPLCSMFITCPRQIR